MKRTYRTRLTMGIVITCAIYLTAAQTYSNSLIGQDPNKSSNSPTQTSDPARSCDDLRSTVQKLNQEVDRLRRRLTDLERDRLVNTIQDQLTKEEQRGEGLQQHLLDIAEKEAPLQSRLDQLTQQLRPERIEAMMAGVGSLRPEEAREEVRKRLTNDRTRVQTQLDLLRQDRVRTQASLVTTDSSIQRLKQKLAEALRN